MKRILKAVFVDFFWKSSYWGISEDETKAMSEFGYMQKYGVGPNIDAWDKRIFKSEDEEPCLLVVAIFVLIFLSAVVFAKFL